MLEKQNSIDSCGQMAQSSRKIPAGSYTQALGGHNTGTVARRKNAYTSKGCYLLVASS